MANPDAPYFKSLNDSMAAMTANSMHVIASFLCFVMMLTVPVGLDEGSGYLG